MENGILAFPHNSSEDRTMRIEKSLKNNRIVSREDMDARVTACFDNVKIEFDEQSKRPYIMFRDGEVKSVSGGFPYGIQKIRFIIKIFLKVKTELTGGHNRIDHVFILTVSCIQIIKAKNQK